MDINTTKESINLNKIICEKKEIINIYGDMIVPDSKPDILNTINATGNVCIYKKEIMDGKIRLDGNVSTYIMYLADSNTDNVRGLNTGLDFSETLNISELENYMNVDVNPIVKFIDCKVINGRKVGIKITLEILMKVYAKNEVELVTDMNDPNIQILTQNIKINTLLGEGETKAYIKENISIPENDNLAEILNAQINLVDKDIKISYNKILAKSDVEIKLAYLTEEGKICKFQTKQPLVGFIDMQNIKEENICETNYMIRNILIKPNSIEEHSVYVEIEVEISCIVYEEKEIKIIQDMYCPGEKMDFDKKIVNTISEKKCNKNICNIREKVNIPELETGTIVDVTVNPIINKENRINEKVLYEGEIELNFIFTDNSAVGVNIKKVVIPFEQTIDGITKNCKTDTNIEINTQEFLNQSGIISVNLDLNFNTYTYCPVSVPVIDNITSIPEEESEDYSVIIYVVKQGDSLWKIAKRFKSTVDDIVRVNGIERPEKLNVSEKIYIPRYVLKRAREPITL